MKRLASKCRMHIVETTNDEQRIQRVCLRCRKTFMAKGRFNRLCVQCTRINDLQRYAETMPE